MSPLSQLRVREIGRVMSTDDIIPGRYKHMFTDTSELATHIFENALPGFAASAREGDVLCSVATFGIGSSREQAVSSLQAAGIRAVIAPSFGRIFFRNAWNLGLIAIELDQLPTREGDLIDIDLGRGAVTGGFGEARFAPPPPEMLEMVAQGGLLAMIAKRRNSPEAQSVSNGSLENAS